MIRLRKYDPVDGKKIQSPVTPKRENDMRTDLLEAPTIDEIAAAEGFGIDDDGHWQELPNDYNLW